MGLMQLMPSSWVELSARYGLGLDPFDARDNILAGTAYLKEMHDRFGSAGFLAAYHAGPWRYEKHLVAGKPLPYETKDYVAAITPLLDNEQGEHAAVDGRREAPLFVERAGRTVTNIRFAFEALQHDHDAKTFGFATEGPSLTRQEFAEECDINVLMAYGRCLRPALYSSLRSSPSHPTGVSALRVTIAIANARFARKQWGLRRSIAKSRRLFRNESATSRRVRAGAIGGSTA
jgi:hypothetical protein